MFSSIIFIYLFLPITLFSFYLTPIKYRKIILLIFSLLFYSTEKLSFVFLMLLCILITYISGILISKFNKNFVFIICILITLLPLVYFKYSNFIIENINYILGINIKIKTILLPLGISFYTFQMISYIADVKMRKIEAEKNIINLSCYITFFPQLVAGPIVKYTEIKEQIKTIKNSFDLFSNGIFLFLVGLAKKVLIANQLGELCALYKGQSISFTWLYAIAYTLQVYFDFSGYSDMAIGLGKMFGINLPKNFNYPFCATSIKDFWKRWHITLSSFFKEYVYIPLGGSKKSTKRTIINLFLVWGLTGLWHGANWNFMLWGLLFSLLLVFEKNINIHKNIKRITTPFIIIFSFVIFGNENFIPVFKNMFSGKFIDEYSLFYIKDYLFIIVLAIVGSTPLIKNITSTIINKIEKKSKIAAILIKELFIIILFLLSTAYIIDGSYNPFLYFRF